MWNYTTNGGSAIRHYVGKTTDTKPVYDVPNGSDWYDMDGNHDVYMFDAETKTWIKQ